MPLSEGFRRRVRQEADQTTNDKAGPIPTPPPTPCGQGAAARSTSARLPVLPVTLVIWRCERLDAFVQTLTLIRARTL